MCNGNTGLIIEFLVFGGGGLLVLLGFIIRNLIEKKKAERRRAEERARQEQIAKEAKKREQMEKEMERVKELKKQKEIETFKNKIKETKELYDVIKSCALYRLYPEIEKMPYRDHSRSVVVTEHGIDYDSLYSTLNLWYFDTHGLPNLKEEQLEEFCVAVLQLMREIILEKDSGLQLSIWVEDRYGKVSGYLSYKGKPIEGSW